MQHSAPAPFSDRPPCPRRIFKRQGKRLPVLQYIREKYPYFNESLRKGFANHVWPTHAHDAGIRACAPFFPLISAQPELPAPSADRTERVARSAY